MEVSWKSYGNGKNLSDIKKISFDGNETVWKSAGSHKEMEENHYGIKSLSLDGYETVWKSAGSHMEMEERPSDIKNISLDGNETDGCSWMSNGNGRILL